MNIRDPSRRKPIHDKTPLDEITQNVKNDAVLTCSRSKSKISKYKLSNSGSEDVLDSKLTRELHQTFTISSSSQNFARRNSGSNINLTSSKKLNNQSPEMSRRESYNINANNDISDDEEDSEDSVTNSSNINSPINFRQRLNSSKSKFSLNNESYKQTPIYQPESFPRQYSKVTNGSRLSNESTSDFKSGLFFLLTLIVGIVVFWYFGSMINRTNSVDVGTQTEAVDVDGESPVLNDLLITIKNMKSKYKNQNKNLWQDAYSSIASLINQETKKPSVIVLLGNKSNPLECLARLLGNVSSKALRSDRLVLTPKEFEADMGSVIQTMRSHLKDNKAIIVSDLLNINVEALKAFHNLCDRINPLVGEAIYIITVIADDYNNSINPLRYIETELHKKLSGKMEKDAIQPLITRLTDGPVLTVNPEPTVTDCSL